MKKSILFSMILMSFNAFSATDYSKIINTAFELEEKNYSCITVQVNDDSYYITCQKYNSENQYRLTLKGNTLTGNGDTWTNGDGEGGSCRVTGKILNESKAKITLVCSRVDD
ncbi:MAG: hypothetical protein K2Q18_02555 [Bdellovibrionales bacterium]|nr:hypothetical protein [Bdellovibrionales bacterium]